MGVRYQPRPIEGPSASRCKVSKPSKLVDTTFPNTRYHFPSLRVPPNITEGTTYDLLFFIVVPLYVVMSTSEEGSSDGGNALGGDKDRRAGDPQNPSK